MIPATELKTSVVILSLLQQIDLALFNKVFGYTRARHAVTQVALAVSKTGDGYAQLFLPLIVWLSGSVLAPSYALALAVAFSLERVSYYVLKNTLKRPRPYDLKPSVHSLIIAADKFSFPSGPHVRRVLPLRYDLTHLWKYRLLSVPMGCCCRPVSRHCGCSFSRRCRRWRAIGGQSSPSVPHQCYNSGKSPR
jgi:hypothetical protein